jgi:RNA polymerase sigma-70 factor, ECF subfamily
MVGLSSFAFVWKETSVANADEILFQGLHDELYQQVYNYLYYKLGDQQTAEEATQETFLKAYEALPALKDREPFSKVKNWLYRIAKNYAIDLLRRRNLVSWTSLKALDLDPLTLHEDPQEGFGDRVLIREALQLIRPEHRDAIVLYTVGGYSYEDLASLLDIKVTGVKMYLTRARQALREKYLELEQGK